MALMRETLRELTVTALSAANTLAGDNIYSPGDWPTNSDTMPAILVNANKEHKESGSRAQPNFTVTSFIEIEAKVLANSGEKARADLTQLCGQIEYAILTNYNIIILLQQISSVDIEVKYNSDSGKHIGHAKLDFGMEFFEVPETPVNPQSLTVMGMNIDLGNVFDPSGAYSNPPFPTSVTPAPRTSGPDGRNEGGGLTDLPQ
jgi:hypothetical protein